jgi:hypothetical protein
MKFPVVTKDDRTFGGNLRQPYVIRRFLSELEFIAGIVVVFDSKGRTRCPEGFRKALPKISIKVER